MSLLKQKIARNQALKLLKRSSAKKRPHQKKVLSRMDDKKQSPAPQPYKKRQRDKDVVLTPQNIRCTKNIVKNFGRAICSFAVSHLSTPYRQSLLKKQNVTQEKFFSHIQRMKESIDGLFKFRDLLMPNNQDTEDAMASKAVFKDISEIFIKYFSVNWITHGKIQHKEAHLKFRFKMLRRIRSPEFFTYLKTGTKAIRA